MADSLVRLMSRLGITILTAAVLLSAAPLTSQADGGKARQGEVIVQLRNGASIDSVNARNGTHILDRIPEQQAFRLRIPAGQSTADAVSRLSRDPDVTFAQSNGLIGLVHTEDFDAGFSGQFGNQKAGSYIPLSMYTNQQAWTDIKLSPAITAAASGTGAVVALLDTGIMENHVLIGGNLTSYKHDFWRNDDIPDEEAGSAFGHGTFIGGLIIRLAPNAKIMPIKILDGNGVGDVFTVAHAMYVARQQGAQIINLSLGTPFDYSVLRNAVEDLTRDGVTIVSSAGNHVAGGSSSVLYPANYPSVVAVAGTRTGSLLAASFTNYGRSVDISAPAVDLYSAYPYSDPSLAAYGLARWSGTSMSSGVVAGSLAVLRGEGSGLKLSTNTAQRRLGESATDLNKANPALRNLLGKGLVNLCGAVLKSRVC